MSGSAPDLIETSYVDGCFQHRNVPGATLERLRQALSRGEGETPFRLLPEQEAARIEAVLGAPPGAAFTWRLAGGAGLDLAGQGAADAAGNAAIDLPSLDAGDYHLTIAAGESRTTLSLLVAPRRCYRPGWMAKGQRLWGIACQLYGIRSPRNWGIGDFTDLQRLVALAAAAGADFIGLNPLHALFAADAGRFSPYSPSSREFLNTLYVDVAAMRAYPESAVARALVEAPAYQEKLRTLRAAEVIDYAAVVALKEAAFRCVFDEFDAHCAADPADRLASAFRSFCQSRGTALQRFAVYQALSCRAGFGTDWRRWPEEYHDPAGVEVAAFAAIAARELRYHAFLQWEAETQLARAAASARQSGMRVGLYLDLAVGASVASAEGWMGQGTVIPGFHVGAPPDLWNEAGQDWGLFAFDPVALAKEGYAPFRRILAANMRHAGAVRIDHVLGLNRLFLVPAGERPTEGAYLRFPIKALAAVLAAESVDHRSIVVGEDLGTVPEALQPILAENGILSYRLLIFGKDGQGRFHAPGDYPRDALVAVSTHDLPTFRGFWSGADIAAKEALGLYPDDAGKRRAAAEREGDRLGIAAALAAAGLPASGDEAALAIACHRFLARTPAWLLLVQMEDLAGEQNQVNLPATTDQYPNWRRRLGRDLDAVFADATASALLAALAAERPRQD